MGFKGAAKGPVAGKGSVVRPPVATKGAARPVATKGAPVATKGAVRPVATKGAVRPMVATKGSPRPVGAGVPPKGIVKGPPAYGVTGAKGAAKGPVAVGKGVRPAPMVRQTIMKPAVGQAPFASKGCSKGVGKTVAPRPVAARPAAPGFQGFKGAPGRFAASACGAKGKGPPAGFAGKGMGMTGKGKDGKGKDGKGKKGKRPAPPANDPFWAQKKQEENRAEGDGTEYPGRVASYNVKAGWGFLRPDDVSSLPQDVQAKLEEAQKAAEAKGKELTDNGLLYFRKPDLQQGFKVEKETPVFFQVYTDDKGAGACSIRPSAETEMAVPEAPQEAAADQATEEATEWDATEEATE